MSTLTYATLTKKREESEPGKSNTSSPPGVKNYIDGLAAIVPAEVLGLHAFVISQTMKTVTQPSGEVVTTIIHPDTLMFSFWSLIIFTVAIYFGVHGIKNWDNWDYVRMLISPLAFVCWTMLQKSTAFDAVFPNVPEAPRTILAVFGAAFLGILATALAKKADEKTP